jgi:transcriptional regulator with XRE-family HTH domain
MMATGKTLGNIRKAASITQGALAAKLGIDQSSLCKLEARADTVPASTKRLYLTALVACRSDVEAAYKAAKRGLRAQTEGGDGK